MANQLPRGGATPICLNGGSPYCGNGNPYWHDSSDPTALGVGDFVVISGSSNPVAVTSAYKAGGAYGYNISTLPSVIKASEGDGDPITGVVVGFGYDPAVYGAGPNYGVASTNYVVFVEDRPNVVYEIQVSGSAGDVDAVDVSLNYNVTSSTPSTTTGRSTAKMDINSGGTGATKQLRFLGVSTNPQRNDQESANVSARVMINNNNNIANTLGV